MLLPPVPDRECGPCNVCCTLPTIIEPTLKKPPGVVCPRWALGVGCTDYENRPGPCRGHFCAWRRIEQLDDSWRPDLCGVYAEVKTDPPERFKSVLTDAAFALKFTIFREQSAHGMDVLMAAVAMLIESGVPVILAVAAPAGHMGGYRLLNAELKPHTAELGPPFRTEFQRILEELRRIPPALVPVE